MATGQSRKTYALVAIALVFVLGGWLFRIYGARSVTLLGMYGNNPDLMPSTSIARNLDDKIVSACESIPRSSGYCRRGTIVYNSLSVLKDRRYTGAQARARELLQSSDEYTWFNAALYLGKLHDSVAVPYLIKGLRHPAYNGHPEAVVDLQAITGQNIGNDFEAWRQWYVAQHPGPFDFEIRRSAK